MIIVCSPLRTPLIGGGRAWPNQTRSCVCLPVCVCVYEDDAVCIFVNGVYVGDGLKAAQRGPRAGFGLVCVWN